MKTPIHILVSLICSIVSVSAFAGREGGGGDLCEDRIQIIRDDIKSWITKGGPHGLRLPTGVSASDYSQTMLAQIDRAKIKCAGPGDAGYPVEVNGTAKVCRYDVSANSNEITCDFAKFNLTNESEQYVLVHHEYAGLAGLEKPDGDVSTYGISNQITGYLENQVIKKLVVRPEASSAVNAGVYGEWLFQNDSPSSYSNEIWHFTYRISIQPGRVASSLTCRVGMLGRATATVAVPAKITAAGFIPQYNAEQNVSFRPWLVADAVLCKINIEQSGSMHEFKYDGEHLIMGDMVMHRAWTNKLSHYPYSQSQINMPLFFL